MTHRRIVCVGLVLLLVATASGSILGKGKVFIKGVVEQSKETAHDAADRIAKTADEAGGKIKEKASQFGNSKVKKAIHVEFVTLVRRKAFEIVTRAGKRLGATANHFFDVVKPEIRRQLTALIKFATGSLGEYGTSPSFPPPSRCRP